MANTYHRLSALLGLSLRNTQYDYLETLESHLRPGVAWFDIGCGRRLIPEWLHWPPQRRQRMVEGLARHVGADLDAPSLRDNQEVPFKLLASIENLPLASACFDLVTANMVVEHLVPRTRALHEVCRVLRPGGRMIFHTPNYYYPLTLASNLADGLLPQRLKDRLVARLEARQTEDVFPTHYVLNTARSIRRAAAAAGLEVESLRRIESAPSTAYSFPLVACGELLFIKAARLLPGRLWASNLIVVLRRPT